MKMKKLMLITLAAIMGFMMISYSYAQLTIQEQHEQIEQLQTENSCYTMENEDLLKEIDKLEIQLEEQQDKIVELENK